MDLATVNPPRTRFRSSDRCYTVCVAYANEFRRWETYSSDLVDGLTVRQVDPILVTN